MIITVRALRVRPVHTPREGDLGQQRRSRPPARWNAIVTPVVFHLGRCTRCMRKSLIAAVSAWALVYAVELCCGVSWVFALAASLALGLSALCAGHILAFTLRTMPASRWTTTMSGPRAAKDVIQSRSWSRRDLAIHSARTLAFIAMAIAIPACATAQTKCDCVVGHIWCNPDTHVTYECQNVQGCNMWILKGERC
jgi:hypothetical protein